MIDKILKSAYIMLVIFAAWIAFGAPAPCHAGCVCEGLPNVPKYEGMSKIDGEYAYIKLLDFEFTVNKGNKRLIIINEEKDAIFRDEEIAARNLDKFIAIAAHSSGYKEIFVHEACLEKIQAFRKNEDFCFTGDMNKSSECKVSCTVYGMRDRNNGNAKYKNLTRMYKLNPKLPSSITEPKPVQTVPVPISYLTEAYGYNSGY
jgi:hypothetical protein